MKDAPKRLVARYKGKRYELLYRGKTRTGKDGAFLMLFNGKRKFWCDLEEISDIEEMRERVEPIKPDGYTVKLSSEELNTIVMALGKSELADKLTALIFTI